jgi:hypothetical protein
MEQTIYLVKFTCDDADFRVHGASGELIEFMRGHFKTREGGSLTSSAPLQKRTTRRMTMRPLSRRTRTMPTAGRMAARASSSKRPSCWNDGDAHEGGREHGNGNHTPRRDAVRRAPVLRRPKLLQEGELTFALKLIWTSWSVL